MSNFDKWFMIFFVSLTVTVFIILIGVYVINLQQIMYLIGGMK